MLRPRGGRGSATAAAAEEQQDDEDDPDPVVVVEYVAQTVVHSEPPYSRSERGWNPSPLSEYVEDGRWCMGDRKKCRDKSEGFAKKFGNTS